MDQLHIRSMRPDEIPLALEWAASEGWNPGLSDADAFSTVDAQGFLVGEVAGEAAAVISCVNYSAHFAFLGFYIVRQDLRGRGHGLRIWKAAIAHAGERVIGLDGVVAQQANYMKSGFQLAYATMRYGGILASAPPATLQTSPLSDVPLAAVEKYDATVFPASRTAFLRSWIATPDHIGRALLRNGELAGFGVIRPGRVGWKVGPLFADDRAAAEAVLAAMLAGHGGDQVFLDVPTVHADAVAIAKGLGLAPVFETARMYTGAIRTVRLERIFGITSLELG